MPDETQVPTPEQQAKLIYQTRDGRFGEDLVASISKAITQAEERGRQQAYATAADIVTLHHDQDPDPTSRMVLRMVRAAIAAVAATPEASHDR